MAGSAKSTFVVISAVGGNFIVAIAKLIGWLLTGSPSMLAEGIHSVADTANQALLYVGIRHSSREPDAQFPGGFGSARYLWNLISAMGIFFVGFGATTYHGVSSLFHPHAAGEHSTAWISFAILLFALIVEGYILMVAYRAVREMKGKRGWWEHLSKGDDPTSVAVLLEDAVAVLGVILAMLGIAISYWYGTALADSIASITIGCLLGAMAVLLAYINGRLLIGTAAQPEEIEQIRKFLEKQSSVEKVHVLHTRIAGPARMRLMAEIEFHGGTLIDSKQIERDADKVRNELDQLVPVLAATAERMVRVVGAEINRLERELRERFPKLGGIELEVH